MTDTIFDTWLHTQYLEAMSFAQKSDMLKLAPVAGAPPYKYLAEFRCDGLVESRGEISVSDRHLIGVSFPSDYLRSSSHPGQVLTWLEPAAEFHPNIRSPFCCVGHIAPGMSLLNLLHQVFQMITWQRYTPREDDALNADACRWARRNAERLPIDSRRSMLDTTGAQETGDSEGGADDR